MWPKQDLMDLLEIELPIIQAPMAGANDSTMAIAVSEAGGLGSLPCGMLDVETASAEMGVIRQSTAKPYNVNFLCHDYEALSPSEEKSWQLHLQKYYEELDIDITAPLPGASRNPFSEEMCSLVERHRPNVVSFHFGLPEKTLLDRVKEAGCTVLSSATTVEEAVWLEAHGCDAIIAQGYEAGGHRGNFLSSDVATQPGTLALVPQVVDAVSIPIIAAGGIADGRGVAAAFALGAAGVQIGTAYLHTPESLVSDLHRQALQGASDNKTALTNLFSGKPARGLMNRLMEELGPMSDQVTAFPYAGGALAPLKAVAEKNGRTDFTSLWAGQSAGIDHGLDAAGLTRQLVADAQERFRALQPESLYPEALQPEEMNPEATSP